MKKWELDKETEKRFDSLFHDISVRTGSGGRKEIYNEKNEMIAYMHPHWGDEDLLYIYEPGIGSSSVIDKNELVKYFDEKDLNFSQEMYEIDYYTMNDERFHNFLEERYGQMGGILIQHYEEEYKRHWDGRAASEMIPKGTNAFQSLSNQDKESLRAWEKQTLYILNDEVNKGLWTLPNEEELKKNPNAVLIYHGEVWESLSMASIGLHEVIGGWFVDRDHPYQVRASSAEEAEIARNSIAKNGLKDTLHTVFSEQTRDCSWHLKNCYENPKMKDAIKNMPDIDERIRLYENNSRLFKDYIQRNSSDDIQRGPRDDIGHNDYFSK